MPSLLELVERVNKGELIDPALLETYQDSTNAAEKFLANHARAMLELRRSHTYLLDALEAIDYADQKVLFQFLSVLGFLGLADQRAQPVIKFGAAALNRREVALGLEAIQSGVVQDQQNDATFTRDRENCLYVASQFDRAAQAVGWYPPGACEWNNTQLKIGYLTSSISDDDGAARTISGLAKHLDQKDVKLHVYTTEANVRREKLSFTQGPFTGASAKRGKETIDTLNRRRAGVWIAPLDQDLATCAKELASQIYRDQIDVLIIDAALGDPVASVVSNWEVAKAKLNLVRRSPLLAGVVDAVVYLDAQQHGNDELFWKKRCVDTHFIQEGVEPAAPDAPASQRSAFGIPDQSIILATTATDGDGSSSPEFGDAIVQILRQHPQTVLLVSGDADTSAIKRRLESAGLGKRVGFTGKRKDGGEFLRMSDIYLAPFPRAATSATLAAMSAGRPVVAMAGQMDDPQRAQAILGDEPVASSVANYVEQVGRLIREPALRHKSGETLKARATEHYAFEKTARAIEKLCRDLLNPAQPETQHAQAA
jgi:predicted O-linked N-acetylglucosamine transferase (SPINDLY family)